MLQGGDCAETFDAVGADAIRAKLKTVLQMAVVLTYGALAAGGEGRPDRRAVRQAAHRGRPRPVTASSCRPTAATWSTGWRSTAAARTPRPARGWSRRTTASAATLNLVRAFTQGGYADLRQVHAWNQDFVRDSPAGRALRADGRRDRPRARVHARLRRRPRGVPPGRPLRRPRGAAARLRARADPDRLAHRAAVRRVRRTSCGSASAPAQLDGAHVDFAARDPQPDRASRSGPTATPDEVARAGRAARPGPRARPAHAHHPDGRRPGPRRAARRSSRRSRRAARPVVWVCDPMHGNTLEAAVGPQDPVASTTWSTRCAGFFEVHRALGHLPRRHPRRAHRRRRHRVRRRHRRHGREPASGERYETACDPRLNREQSLELAFLVAEMLADSVTARRHAAGAPAPASAGTRAVRSLRVVARPAGSGSWRWPASSTASRDNWLHALLLLGAAVAVWSGRVADRDRSTGRRRTAAAHRRPAARAQARAACLGGLRRRGGCYAVRRRWLRPLHAGRATVAVAAASAAIALGVGVARTCCTTGRGAGAGRAGPPSWAGPRYWWPPVSGSCRRCCSQPNAAAGLGRTTPPSATMMDTVAGRSSRPDGHAARLARSGMAGCSAWRLARHRTDPGAEGAGRSSTASDAAREAGDDARMTSRSPATSLDRGWRAVAAARSRHGRIASTCRRSARHRAPRVMRNRAGRIGMIAVLGLGSGCTSSPADRAAWSDSR